MRQTSDSECSPAAWLRGSASGPTMQAPKQQAWRRHARCLDRRGASGRYHRSAIDRQAKTSWFVIREQQTPERSEGTCLILSFDRARPGAAEDLLSRTGRRPSVTRDLLSEACRRRGSARAACRRWQQVKERNLFDYSSVYL